MVNQHGIEWVVQEHVALPTYDSLHRWREGDVVPAQDLYPVIVPTNFSQRLTEFLLAIDRCTTKTFAFVDTMPGRRRDGHVPGGNHIDTICHPTANIVYLDAARVHETIIAHELGHAWLQYVDECEDLRVMRDASDPQRLRLLCFVQSFVLDLKVNELIRQKGFDMAPIEADHHASVVQLAEFLNNGGKTNLPREEVVWAMSIAERLLVKQSANAKELARLDAALPVIRMHAPTVMALAETMAAAVRRHGFASREGMLASIDECLKAAFEYCGDCIDLEHELVEVQSEEPHLDKWPTWIEGASVALKTTVGKVMAREGIPSTARWSLSDRGHQTLLQFVLENGEHTEGWLLDHSFPFRDPLEAVRMHMENQRRHAESLERQLAGVDRINRENRERQEQMLRSTGAHLPTVPQMPEFPVASGHLPVSNNVGLRPDCLGLPPGKEVRELLPSTLSGSTPSALFGPGSLSLPARARHYMAGLGRFLTAARLQEQLEGEHPYGYALNNPVTYTDPTGRKVYKCWRRVVPGFGFQIWAHWYFKTDAAGCPCIGYGTGGVEFGCAKNRDNQGEVCEEVKGITPAQEQCLCDLAKNADKGWKLCTVFWTSGNYNNRDQNCQHFLNALMMKCTGDTLPGADWGAPPWDYSDCLPAPVACRPSGWSV